MWHREPKAAGQEGKGTPVPEPSRYGGTMYNFGGEFENSRSPYGATAIPAVFRAVAVLSDSVGKLPFRYMSYHEGEGRFVECRSTGRARRLYDMLTVSPDGRMTAFEFFKNMVKTMLLHGNAYVIPERDRLGDIVRLVLCVPKSVSYDEFADRYTVFDVVNGISGVYRGDEVIHVRNESLDGGLTGLSTLEYARQQLGIASASGREAMNRVANGGRFKALVSNDYSVKGWGAYQDDQMREGVVDRLQEQVNNGRDILFLPGDVKMTQMSMTSADMQFLDQMKYTVREVARLFNVPPALLMDDTNANYKSGEMSSVLLLSYGLSPILRKIEQEFRLKLVPEGLRGSFRFEFDLSALFSTDLSTRGAWMKSQLETGAATVNELRRENGKASVEGGDTAFVSANLLALDSERLRGAASGNVGGISAWSGGGARGAAT